MSPTVYKIYYRLRGKIHCPLEVAKLSAKDEKSLTEAFRERFRDATLVKVEKVGFVPEPRPEAQKKQDNLPHVGRNEEGDNPHQLTEGEKSEGDEEE